MSLEKSVFVYVKLIGQRIVMQLFRHLQLHEDNYFCKSGDVHEIGIIVIFNNYSDFL